ncbi:MAG: hypothetical protein EPN82_13295 [Bacteroidetes bacterium]|nr:MAG: hypothetical protein EPN82_13295 [Bacteroidota bacterium]
MSKIITKIGDIFSVQIDDNNKKYMQYIINDMTQLNSDVIRAFKTVYQIDDNFDLADILKGEVEFYSHCVLDIGIKYGYWKKVGNIVDVGKINHILFRDSSDYGNPAIKVSNNWWVWKINDDQKYIGKLRGKYLSAEIGIVVTPEDIVTRLRTGKYDFVYPGY